MTPWSILALPILAALTITLSAQVNNYGPHHRLLAKQSGAKHLEWLSPADPDERMEDFDEPLARKTKATLDNANDEKTACANITMGLSKYNYGIDVRGCF